MAANRGKSQARRRGGGNAPLPGWAWMVLGIVLTIAVLLAAPRFLGDKGKDGFFRPQPNPDAQPLPSAVDEDAQGVVAPRAATTDKPTSQAAPAAGNSAEQDYDFYTLLPGQEVAMSDEQLAAATREEAARRQRDAQRQSPNQQATPVPQAIDNTDLSQTATQSAAAPSQTASIPPAAPPAGQPASAPMTSPAPVANDSPYILQAGAFGASGDAEAVKAKIALLGLNARVESATIQGKTMYRVRMGPYGTASELAEAKGKLATGGLPAMAIKAK